MALLKLLGPCLVLRSYSAQHLGLFHHSAMPEGPFGSPTLHSTPSSAPDHLHNMHLVSGAPQPSIILLSALTSPDLPPHLCTTCAFCWAAMPTFPFKVCLTCKVLGSQGFSTPPIRRKIFSEIPCISFVGLWWSQTHPPLFCTDLYSELISSAISISNWWRTETKIVVRFMYLHST